MSLKLSRPQLFGGSEDEEGGDEGEDDSRFDIRPQFEGAAGQKVRKLVHTKLHLFSPWSLTKSCPNGHLLIVVLCGTETNSRREGGPKFVLRH